MDSGTAEPTPLVVSPRPPSSSPPRRHNGSGSGSAGRLGASGSAGSRYVSVAAAAAAAAATPRTASAPVLVPKGRIATPPKSASPTPGSALKPGSALAPGGAHTPDASIISGPHMLFDPTPDRTPFGSDVDQNFLTAGGSNGPAMSEMRAKKRRVHGDSFCVLFGVLSGDRAGPETSVFRRRSF